MKFRRARLARLQLAHSSENLLVRSRYQNVVLAVAMTQHRSNDFRNMLRRLPFAENYFGKSLSQSAMMIDLCESQILERQMLQPLDRLRRRKLSRPHQL